jgi:hypothetical protein
MQYSSTKYRDLQISTDLETISNSKEKTKSNIKETLESNIKEKLITHGINHPSAPDSTPNPFTPPSNHPSPIPNTNIHTLKAKIK